jgi:hypothetical protein
MTRYFLFPFHAAGVLLVVTFTLGLLICLNAGFLGIPAGVLFISWFFKYCFVLLDAVIAGAEEPPVLDTEMLNPINEQRPLAQAVILTLGVMLTVWIWRHGGAGWAYLCAAVLVVALPASIGVMGLSGDPLRAAWPPELIRLIRFTRGYYLIPLVMVVVTAAGVVWMISTGAAEWLWIAGAQLLLLLTFALVGGIIHENRFELGIETLTRQEREQARAEREHLGARAQMLDRAYTKFNVRQPLEGWEEIQKWLAAYSDEALLIEQRAIFEAASAWPDVRPADRLANDLIAALLARRRTGEALEVAAARLAKNPQFRPAQEPVAARLIELAGLAGKRALRRQFEAWKAR